MYLIHLSCSCQVELCPMSDTGPVFHLSKNCPQKDKHVEPYCFVGASIARIQKLINADEVVAAFDFDDDVELTGYEIFH